MIAFDDLSKHYGNIVAVNHRDLSAKVGEVFGVIGPNNVKKMTTNRVIVVRLNPPICVRAISE